MGLDSQCCLDRKAAAFSRQLGLNLGVAGLKGGCTCTTPPPRPSPWHSPLVGGARQGSNLPSHSVPETSVDHTGAMITVSLGITAVRAAAATAVYSWRKRHGSSGDKAAGCRERGEAGGVGTGLCRARYPLPSPFCPAALRSPRPWPCSAAQLTQLLL